jgi:hypothetical protein
MKYQKLLEKYLKYAGSFVNAFEHPEDHKNLLLDFARWLDQEDYAAQQSVHLTGFPCGANCTCRPTAESYKRCPVHGNASK